MNDSDGAFNRLANGKPVSDRNKACSEASFCTAVIVLLKSVAAIFAKVTIALLKSDLAMLFNAF